MPIDQHAIRPYGDTLNDGKVQLSFTLPMADSAEAQEAARRLAEKMGMRSPEAVHMQDLGEGFSLHVLYGSVGHSVDATAPIRAPSCRWPCRICGRSRMQVRTTVQVSSGSR